MYGLGVVNGTGDGGLSEAGAFDENSEKDVYGRLAVKLGGMSISGDGESPPGGEPWEDNSLTIGASAYRGWPESGSFLRYGGDLQLRYSGLDLFGAVLAGEDNVAESDDPEFLAWFVEADQVILPWLIAIARYGNVEGRGPGAAADSQDLLLAINASIRPNLVLRLESLTYLEGEAGDRARLRLDVVY